MSYSPRERLEMICAGETPDRYAASFWRHFFHMEHHAEGTAEAMVYFQKTFNWDFMKINPRADYHVEDWGFKHEWSHDEFAKHKKTGFPIKTIEDWKKIKPHAPTVPGLEEHLRVTQLIRKQVDKELPILMTVFTPIAIASRMIEDRAQLAEHLRKEPDTIHAMLGAITETFEKFCEELRNAGADGIFLAPTQWGADKYITWEEYKQFGVPYDLRLLKATGDDAFNIMHVCDSSCYIREIYAEDYPVKMYNWDTDDPTNPPVDIGLEFITDKPIIGGCDYRGWLLQATPAEVGYKIEMLKEQFPSNRLVFGPGCAIDPKVPFKNLQAIKEKL